jgi:hypothetical protein
MAELMYWSNVTAASAYCWLATEFAGTAVQNGGEIRKWQVE